MRSPATHTVASLSQLAFSSAPSKLLARPHAHLVDMPAAQRGFVGDVWTRIAQVTSGGRYDLAEICPVGVLGDPTKASAEAGVALQAAADAVYVEI